MLIEVGEGRAITLPDNLPRRARRLQINRAIHITARKDGPFFMGASAWSGRRPNPDKNTYINTPDYFSQLSENKQVS